jgi:hypothetical protein
VFGEHLLNSINVALRINDKGYDAVMNDITAVSKSGRINHYYVWCTR